MRYRHIFTVELRKTIKVLGLGIGLTLASASPALADHTSALIKEALEAEAEGKVAIKAYEAKFDRADRDLGMISEDNLIVTMSDGTEISVDIYRPSKSGEYPVILAMTPYQKDMPWKVPSDHEAEQGEHQSWELPNPERWVPKGYVLVRADVRGTGESTGKAVFGQQREWQDFYETIEWAGAQNWSNGNVGLNGISYMAMNQWHVADLQPPSLKAILPWEGLADVYRDAWYPGGIASLAFMQAYMPEFYRDHTLRGWKNAATEESFETNHMWKTFYHNLRDEFWESGEPDWSKVTVPMLSAGNWGGWKGAGHLRGNMEGYKQAASTNKQLRVHTGDHQDAYYSEEGFLEQLRFYDRWLLGLKNGWEKQAPVRIAVRNGPKRFDFKWRDEQEWPLARTDYQKLYLDVDDKGNGTFAKTLDSKVETLSYNSPGILLADEVKEPNSSIRFVSAPFETDVEITGEILLNVWMSSTIEDAFPHATLMRVTKDGNDVVTVGRLRASQRALDKAKTTPSRPYHKHTSRDFLTPGEPVELQIEIWPTSMVYPAGSRLMLVLAGDSPMTLMGTPLANRKAKHGVETVHAGDKYKSYLQIPVIPAKKK